MKNFVIIMLVTISFFSCKKIKDLTTFDIKNSSSFDVPANAGITGLLPSILDTIKTNSSQEFANNKTNADHVQDVKLKSLSLTINPPSTQTFNFLKSIKIYISAPGVSEVLLASKTTIPDSVQTLALDPSGEKLDEFIKKDSYTLRIETETKKGNEAFNMTANSVFSVTAKLL